MWLPARVRTVLVRLELRPQPRSALRHSARVGIRGVRAIEGVERGLGVEEALLEQVAELDEQSGARPRIVHGEGGATLEHVGEISAAIQLAEGFGQRVEHEGVFRRDARGALQARERARVLAQVAAQRRHLEQRGGRRPVSLQLDDPLDTFQQRRVVRAPSLEVGERLEQRQILRVALEAAAVPGLRSALVLQVLELELPRRQCDFRLLQRIARGLEVAVLEVGEQVPVGLGSGALGEGVQGFAVARIAGEGSSVQALRLGGLLQRSAQQARLLDQRRGAGRPVQARGELLPGLRRLRVPSRRLAFPGSRPQRLERRRVRDPASGGRQASSVSSAGRTLCSSTRWVSSLIENACATAAVSLVFSHS
jgi:hypothetical protein